LNGTKANSELFKSAFLKGKQEHVLFSYTKNINSPKYLILQREIRERVLIGMKTKLQMSDVQILPPVQSA
jgi:hypothetical protein